MNKPGPLKKEERTLIQAHPQFAYDMLCHIEYLRPALEIPSCRLERWDGTGDPRGWKGGEIPLSVVDVWDALTSGRPFEKPGPGKSR